MALDQVLATGPQGLERQVVQRAMGHDHQPGARLQRQRRDQHVADLARTLHRAETAGHDRIAECPDEGFQRHAWQWVADFADAIGCHHPGQEAVLQRMELDHPFVGPQHGLDRLELQRAGRFTGQGTAVANLVEQGACAAALAVDEGLGGLALLRIEVDGALEDVLHVREQAHLEFLAAKACAHLVQAVDRLAQRRACTRAVAQRMLGPRQAFQCPHPLVGRIGAGVGLGQRLEAAARLRRLSFGQQQLGVGAFELSGQARILGHGHLVESGACARRISALYQRVDQRGLHQRAVAFRAAFQRQLITLHRQGVFAAALLHVADDLVGRTDDLGRILCLVLQRLAGELLGLVQVARVAVCDGQVAVGLGHQVLVAGTLADVQGLAGRTHAFAELTPFGQGHRLAAVLVAVQLDLFLRIQQRAFATQLQGRVGILHARHRLVCVFQFGAGHVGRRGLQDAGEGKQHAGQQAAARRLGHCGSPDGCCTG